MHKTNIFFCLLLHYIYDSVFSLTSLDHFVIERKTDVNIH